MIAQAQTTTFIDILAIILSVVSLFITIMGFFASLRFYRDGVSLQQKANDALTKLEEKTQFIQSQVGGMFDKTLDAAIGKKEVLSAHFEQIYKQLEEAQTKITKIVEDAIKDIGTASDQERKQLLEMVNNQISRVREKVEKTRESTEDAIGPLSFDDFRESRVLFRALAEINPRGVIKSSSISSINRHFRQLERDGYIEPDEEGWRILPKGSEELNRSSDMQREMEEAWYEKRNRARGVE